VFDSEGNSKILERSVAKAEVFWFCADRRCTRSEFCVQSVTGYLWGTTQQCCEGSVVKVIGEVPRDVEDRLTSGTRALFLAK